MSDCVYPNGFYTVQGYSPRTGIDEKCAHFQSDVEMKLIPNHDLVGVGAHVRAPRVGQGLEFWSLLQRAEL